MAKLIWDKAGEHKFETGVDHGVLFVAEAKTGAETRYSKGVPWNGLTTVTQSPSGAEATALYADNIKYLNILSVEDFGATIEAYSCPDEFGICDGTADIAPGIQVSQQERRKFCFSYRTVSGNDLDVQAGYKLHIIYNCLAQPSERSYETVNDSPAAITLSWEVSTTPVDVPNMKPTAHLVIDSTKVSLAVMKLIEDALYGTETEESKLLFPSDIVEIINDAGQVPPAEVPVESVTVNKESLSLVKDKKETLTATVKPDNATNKKVVWSTNNDKIAAVNAETGEVTAAAAGIADITAKSEADNTKLAVCRVTVTDR